MTGRAGLERQVWTTLRGLVLERGDHRREVAEALGLSFQRVKALRMIADADPPPAVGELAAALVTDKPYTTVIVRDLVERGLVVAQPHPRDGRSKILLTTPAGRDLAARAAELLNQPPPELAGLTGADLAELDRILGLIGPDPSAG